MQKVKITGLEVTARHGVLAEEKVNAQPFVFDATIDCDFSAAAVNDDLSLTVNYAEACQVLTDFCKVNCFNLIETLACRSARLLLEKFPIANRAEVTVHKPEAPIGLPFKDVSVTAAAERNKALLSLGSSAGDRKQTLDGALSALDGVDGVKILKVSKFIETEPYGGAAKNMFLNCAAVAECLISPRRLLEEIHKIEKSFGRVRAVRWGDRTLDIDIVFFGDKAIAEEGLCVPHPDYLNRPFVLVPLKEIAPDFVCPKTFKRIADM